MEKEEIIRRKKPEEQELEQKLSQLAVIEEELAQCELELATLQAELYFFEKEFVRIVGHKYAELDQIEALIAEYIASLNLNNQQTQKKAREYREAAQESAEAVNEDDFDQEITKEFKPSEKLKKLYHEAAKLIHPDLATDERERARRHHVMADVNQAYQDGDEERLQQILHQWECSPESVESEGVGAELIRVIRKITQATERLEEVKKHIETIKNSDLFMLKTKVFLAREYGRDILAEMAAEVEEQITEAKKRYKDLCGTGGKNMPGKKDEKNRSIVSSGQQSITKYSSDLVRRGLDAIAKIEQKDRGLIPCRKKITLENARLVRQIAWLDIEKYRYKDWGSVEFIKYSLDGKLFAVVSTRGIWFCEANKLNMAQEIETGINSDTKDHIQTSGPIEKFAYLWRVTNKFPYCEEIVPAEEDYQEYYLPGEIEDLELSAEEVSKIKNIHFERKKDDLLFLHTIKGYGFPGMFNIRGKSRSCLALSSDCTILAVGDNEAGNIRLINMLDGSILGEIKFSSVKSLAFSPVGILPQGSRPYPANIIRPNLNLSPDGTLLALCETVKNNKERVFLFGIHKDFSLSVYDILVETKGVFLRNNIIFSPVVYPEGFILAIYNRYEIYLWLIPSRSQLNEGKVYAIKINDKIRSLAFSPDGALLACSCDNGSIYILRLHIPSRFSDNVFLYDIQKLEEIKENIINRGSLISPGGMTLAFNENYKTEYRGRYYRNNLVFSPDSSILVSSKNYEIKHVLSSGYTFFYYYNYIRLWDVSNASLLHEMNSPGTINNLTFSPDGKILMSCNSKTVQFWGL